MARKLLTTLAAGAMFATAFAPAAFSQDATQPQPASPNAATTAPATPAPATPSATSDMSANAGGAGSYLTQQAPDQISANTYIGQSVYNNNNESIGNINDLIMKKDGGIVAAVVGVGGFLGIGEKNVAVPFEKITAAQNAQDGSVKLTTAETADALKSAPEFKTLQMQSAEKAPAQNGTGAGTDASSTGSTTAK